VNYLLSVWVTAPKRSHRLNSNLLDTTPPKPLNRLSWNVMGMFLRIPSCALFDFNSCINFQNLLWLLLNCSSKYTEIFRTIYISMISCALFIYFSRNCAKHMNCLNSKFIIATTFHLFNGFSWNVRAFYLVFFILPCLFSYCRTALKELNQLKSNLLELLLLNRSTKWADIFRGLVNTTDN